MKRCFLLLMIAALLSTSAFALEPPTTEHVRAAILYEATTDTVLYEKSADLGGAPASMTKVMTAILVLEQNPTLDGTLTVAEDALKSQYCSWLDDKHLLVGEVISVRECMKYLLIPSGNEAATSLACYIAGSVPAFVERMNEKAAELGCADTHFDDCVGLASGTHRTTPRDMLTMVQYAMQFDAFREIVAMKSGMVPASNMRARGFRYSTTNRVMDPRSKKYYESENAPYVIGVKTGTTNAAGYCFAGCMERDGLVFYSVVMHGGDVKMDDGQTYQGNFLDTIELYDYARHFALRTWTQGEAVTQSNTVLLAGGFSIPLTVREDVRLLNADDAENTPVFTLSGTRLLPPRAGETVGTMTVTRSDGQTVTVDLVPLGVTAISPLLPTLLLVLIALILVGSVLMRRRARSRKQHAYHD